MLDILRLICECKSVVLFIIKTIVVGFNKAKQLLIVVGAYPATSDLSMCANYTLVESKIKLCN